ncbi:hypothetical protein ACFWGK_34095, partial [Streptomyces rubiginosohelvolus]
YTGALHASVISYSSGFGDVFKIPNPTKKEIQFLKWLGVRYSDVSENLERIHFTFDNLNEINSNKIKKFETVILDFTELGFGPAAILITNNELVYEKAEKIKIFGSYDLRTMWTQERDDSHIEPVIQ